MIIHVDVPFGVQPTQVRGDRRFYASADPRVIVRCDGLDLATIQTGEYVDALVGWDSGEYTDFVLPGNANKRHTKITIKRALGAMPDEFSINEALKPLSAILARAPKASPLFDADRIATEVVAQITQHLSDLARRISAGGWLPSTAPAADFCPLREEIGTLCRIANGEIDLDDAPPEAIDEYHQLAQDIAELTVTWWGQYDIPADWRATELGRAWQAVAYRLAVQGEALLTLSEAAQRIYGEATSATLTALSRLIDQTDTVTYVDPGEANPRRSRRLTARDVETLVAMPAMASIVKASVADKPAGGE